MPPRLLQATTNVSAGNTTSLVRFPSSGRASGRVDSILFLMDFENAVVGAPSWALPSALRLYVDDPNPGVSGYAFELNFLDAWMDGQDAGTPGLGMIGWQGSASDYWGFVLYHRFLFRYYFDIKAYMDNTGSPPANIDFHTTVFFEEF